MCYCVYELVNNIKIPRGRGFVSVNNYVGVNLRGKLAVKALRGSDNTKSHTCITSRGLEWILHRSKIFGRIGGSSS